MTNSEPSSAKLLEAKQRELLNELVMVRLKSEVRQDVLAQRMETSQANVARLEKIDASNPRLDTLMAWADALDLELTLTPRI